jgi:deoxyribodipyrimidine photolyase-related protein
MHHSNISFLINIGLLTPLQVIKEANKYKKKVPIQSFEGFIRQIIGWREYMRYIYVKYPEIESENFWGNTSKINWKQMYGYTPTKIEILDGEIKKLERTAWNHHIVRLMVFLNYFVLSGINPQDIKRWFLEVVALDSYEWVMVSNIWTMGYFTKQFTSRPYISSTNYLKKMSDYTINPEFDMLYQRFKKSKSNLKYYKR